MEDRISIVLRGDDLEKFREIRQTMRGAKSATSNIDVMRALMRFYEANSPLMR